MKRFLMLFLCIMSLSIFASCEKEAEEVRTFKQGDELVKDGVIYTYYDEENLFKDTPFIEEDNYKSYYNYYYYDMSDFTDKKKITAFEGDLLEYDALSDGIKFNPVPFRYFLENCDLAFSPTMAEFYRLKDYFSLSYVPNGFIVTGYTEDLPKDVVIPSKIYNDCVLQIGFKAFENAPMETLTFITDELKYSSGHHFELIHPFAISNCPNLVEVKTYARVLSMGISNCPKLKEIYYIHPTGDCTLYNLPELNSLEDINPEPITSWNYGKLREICFYQTWGFRKSAFYLCPNLIWITGEKISRKDYVYYRGDFPYYALSYNSESEILLKDLFFTVEGYGRANTITYNPETLELNLPYLNTGLSYQGNIYKHPASTLIEEKEDTFYISVSYPKISGDLTKWPTEFNEPIVLKFTKQQK